MILNIWYGPMFVQNVIKNKILGLNAKMSWIKIAVIFIWIDWIS